MEQISAKIQALKKTFGDQLCIMGHHYQKDAVIRHCDFVGDSLELSRRVPSIQAEHIVFCGVFFMGESAALLAQEEQKVYLPKRDAECMMSLMAVACHVRNVLEELNTGGRKVLPLTYVNTSLDLKAVTGEYGGAVCTSANAVKMLRWAFDHSDAVLFLPDKHLGRNTARQLGLTEKEWCVIRLSGDGLMHSEEQDLERKLLLWPGCCPIHGQYLPVQIETMRKAHPGCTILVHPECPPEIVNLCDGAGSTSFLIKEAERYAQTDNKTMLVIGTENNLVHRLAERYADIYSIVPLASSFCPDMNAITEASLLHLLEAIADGTAKPLVLPPKNKQTARLALTRMLEVCAEGAKQ